jgi:hypothetical protein
MEHAENASKLAVYQRTYSAFLYDIIKICIPGAIAWAYVNA